MFRWQEKWQTQLHRFGLLQIKTKHFTIQLNAYVPLIGANIKRKRAFLALWYHYPINGVSSVAV